MEVFRYRWRDFVVWLTLFNHLIITLGFPLPTPNRKKPTGDIPYPCQSRPCGCSDAEQCWQGDCCCFTLEEKLAWAETNSVEPPPHVRPLVESRRSRSDSPKKKSCCSDAEPSSTPCEKAQPTCCEKQKPVSTCCSEEQKPVSTCCSEKSSCEEAEDSKCPHCADEAKSSCCKKKELPSQKQSRVRWVVGLFAQKCRGEGPLGLYKHDPVIVAEHKLIFLPESASGERVIPHSDQIMSLTHCPPTPPPRSH